MHQAHQGFLARFGKSGLKLRITVRSRGINCKGNKTAQIAIWAVPADT